MTKKWPKKIVIGIKQVNATLSLMHTDSTAFKNRLYCASYMFLK